MSSLLANLLTVLTCELRCTSENLKGASDLILIGALGLAG
jgi:hypothetical protein